MKRILGALVASAALATAGTASATAIYAEFSQYNWAGGFQSVQHLESQTFFTFNGASSVENGTLNIAQGGGLGIYCCSANWHPQSIVLYSLDIDTDLPVILRGWSPDAALNYETTYEITPDGLPGFQTVDFGPLGQRFDIGISIRPVASAFRLDNFRAAAVPEPATWAMMIIGFGIVGSVARRRSASQVAVAET